MAAIHQGDAFMLPFTLSSGTEDITPAGWTEEKDWKYAEAKKVFPLPPRRAANQSCCGGAVF